MVGWIGDTPDKIHPHIYADADFAGCTKTARSTSGVYLCLEGPDTRFPLQGQSKRQTCVSHSTPEAEIVAADFALRTIGIPALSLWETILQRQVTLTFHEDNAAMIQVMTTGHNPTMRHLGRTHRVDVMWLHERFKDDWLSLVKEDTLSMAGDIFTKGLTSQDVWERVCRNIYHVDPSHFWGRMELFAPKENGCSPGNP